MIMVFAHIIDILRTLVRQMLVAQVSHLYYKMLESLNVLSLLPWDSFCLSSEVRKESKVVANLHGWSE
jgi:hypothetical protein